MATDQIITLPDGLATLKTPSLETTMAAVKALDLIARLKAANETAWTPGHGLAAIQIGVPLRFAWFQLDGKEYLLLNPKILEYKGQWKTVLEGCLSMPHRWLRIKRASKVRVENGAGDIFTAKGKLAQIIQHEIDHMDGILITDRQ